jgi:hypothetical protein
MSFPSIAVNESRGRNGHGHNDRGRAGHPNDRHLSEAIGWLIADLKAVEELRRGELRKLRGLRHEVYHQAREVGLSPALLRALAALNHSPRRSRRNGGNGRA